MKNQNGKTLVVQITGEEIRIARGGAGQLQDQTVVPTPAGAVEDGAIRDPEALAELLGQQLKGEAFRRCRRAVVLLCSSQVISERVTVPEVRQRKRLDQMLRANMDMYFPVNPEEFRLTWQVEGREEAEGKSLRVRLWAVPQALLDAYYAMFNGLGITVSGVVYCGYAAAEAVGASFGEPRRAHGEEPSGEGACLYLNLEAEAVLLTFVQEGQVRLQRLLQRGYAVQDDLNEISMVLDYFAAMPGRPTLARAAVSGGQAEEKALRSGLELLLSVPLETENAACGPAWLLCQGAAGADLDFGDPEQNHLTGAAQPISRPWQYGLIFLGGAALAASILLMATSRLSWSTQLAGLRSTQSQLMVLAEQNAGSSQNYETYSEIYDDYSSDWDTVFDSVRTYNDNLVLVLEVLETRLPTDASVTALSTTDRALAVQVAFEDMEDAAYFLVSLRNAPYMSIQGISNLTVGAKEEYSPDNMLSALYGETESAPAVEDATDGGTDAGADGTTENAASGEEAPTEGSYSLEDLFSSAASGNLTIDGATLRQMLPVLSAAGVDASIIQRLTEYADMMERYGITMTPDNMDLISGVLGGLLGGSSGSSSSGSSGSSNSSNTNGSSNGSSSSSTGSSTESDAVTRLRLNLQYLSADQLDALQTVYGPEQDTTYDLRPLLDRATLSERRKAIETLLTEDPSAMYKFFLLMQEDIARDEGDRILYNLIFDAVWENADMHRMFFESDQTLLDEYLPDLVDALTKNRQTVEATEKLIQEDDNLAEKLAAHLAAAMGRNRNLNTALDLERLREEMDSGAALQRGSAVANAVRVLLAAEQQEESQGAASDQDLLEVLALIMAMNQNQGSGLDIDDIFGGGGQGQVTVQADNRYFLTIVLGYDDSLIQLEQARKGLDRDAKVEKVEVDQ